MRTADALDRVTQRSRDAGGDGAETAESAHELREVLQDLATLYNDYAARYQLWGLCLECVHVASFTDSAYVRQLWDVHLKAVIDDALGGQPGTADDSKGEGPSSTALDAAAAEVARLGRRFCPSTISFPGVHIVKRLEQIGGGQWPYEASPCNSSVAAEAIIHATGSAVAATKMYARVLEVAGGSSDGSDLHAPLLRMRLLRSACHTLRLAQRDCLEHKAMPFGAYGGGASASREAGDLSENAAVLLTEARRLPSSGDADDLAKTLQALQLELASQASHRH